MTKYPPRLYLQSPMLLGMDLIHEVVHSVFLTSRLSTDAPVSLMLIAKPESGKTSVVLSEASEEAAVCSDATGGGITAQLVDNPKAGHIIINDMVAVMAHKESVNKRTFAIMNAMSEEGLFKIAMPGSGYYDFKGRRCGIICCIPEHLVFDQRRWWNNSGFASRFLPFAYKFSKELIVQIKREVLQSGAYERRNGTTVYPKTKPPRDKVVVAIPAPQALVVQDCADTVAKSMEEIGLRRGKQFRALVRGHALLRNSKTVGPVDTDFLLAIARYICYQVEEEITSKHDSQRASRPVPSQRGSKRTLRDRLRKSG